MNRINSYPSEIVMQDGIQSVKTRESKEKENNQTENKSKDIEAATIEKNTVESFATYKKTSSKVDTATIQKLKQEAEEKTMQFRNLVEKLLLKQSNKVSQSSIDVYEVIRSGKLEIDDETKKKAAEEISEDGYWGVEQTSERLFSFAKALAGNDPAKADEMVEAFKKGYQAAEKTWGGELPKICQETYDAFLNKIENWKNSNTKL